MTTRRKQHKINLFNEPSWSIRKVSGNKISVINFDPDNEEAFQLDKERLFAYDVYVS